MVRTGSRAARLSDALEETGRKALPVSAAPARPSVRGLPPNIGGELFSLYRGLGGIESMPSFRPGAWDLFFADDLIVELDEELHFN
jgi:hypothetical protein